MYHTSEPENEGKKADELVFSTKDGKPLDENTLFRVWKRARKNAGVKYIPLYQASRHSMATQIMADHKKRLSKKYKRSSGITTN